MSIIILLTSALAQAESNPAVQEGGITFTKLFLRYESLLITAASWVIIQIIQKSMPSVADHPAVVRMKPVAAVVISIGMAFLPSFRLGSWDETLLYGIVLGSMTGFGQKILKQTLLGQDHRIQPVIEDPELRKKIAEHLATKGMIDGDGHSRKRLREKIKHLIT